MENDNFLWDIVTDPKKVMPNEPTKGKVIVSWTRGFKLELDLKLIRARKNTRIKLIKSIDVLKKSSTEEITGVKFELSK